MGAGGIVNDAHLPAYRKAGFRIESIYDADQFCAEETVVRFDIPHVCNSLASLAEGVGFGCVPGSRKSNYCFSGEWRYMAENIGPCVRRVNDLAGTAVIFTEALTHGALPWTGQGERRTIFFKYSPHPMSWSARYFDGAEFKGLTDRKRAILEAPNARYVGRK